MPRIIVALLVLCSAVAAQAAETPAPASTNAPAAVVTTRTVKVHSGCKPKRTGRRGGGVDIKHNCRTKTTEGKTQK